MQQGPQGYGPPPGYPQQGGYAPQQGYPQQPPPKQGMSTFAKIMIVLLVLGVGNLLMGDEGVGIHVLRTLERAAAIPGVRLLDGGTGFDYARYDDAGMGVVVSLAAGLGFGGAALGDRLVGKPKRKRKLKTG